MPTTSFALTYDQAADAWVSGTLQGSCSVSFTIAVYCNTSAGNRWFIRNSTCGADKQADDGGSCSPLEQVWTNAVCGPIGSPCAGNYTFTVTL